MGLFTNLDKAIANGSQEDFEREISVLFNAAEAADVPAVLRGLGDRIEGQPLDSPFVSLLALLCGAFIERAGADPHDFPGAVFDRLLALLGTVEGEDDDRDLPSYEGLERAAMACLSRCQDLRVNLPQRSAILARITRYRERYSFLSKMLNVLHDEPFLVVHAASHRAFAFRVSGAADNFQLHILLLGALAGEGPDRIEGIVPSVAAVESATDMPACGESVVSNWQLANVSALAAGDDIASIDARKHWIWNEGFPAEIEVFEGQRVVLVAPSMIRRGFTSDRVFDAMHAQIVPAGVTRGNDVIALIDRMRSFAQAKHGPGRDE